MNAYKLAVGLENHFKNNFITSESALLLRQQADRIAELEGEVSHLKHINKNWSISEGLALQRIAELQEFAIWLTGCGYDFTQHEYFIKCRDKLLVGIETPQTKPLSDEEIDKIIYSVDWAYNPVLLARAIEERHGIK